MDDELIEVCTELLQDKGFVVERVMVSDDWPHFVVTPYRREHG